MARTRYGGTGGEVLVEKVTDPDAAGGFVYAPATGVFDVYTTRTGSTVHTDLLTAAGGATTTVSPDADGRVEFQGLDGYKDDYYIQKQGTIIRWRVPPESVANRVTAVEAAIGGSGYYTMPVGGIPVSDLDAAGEALVNDAIAKQIVNVKGDLVVASANDTVVRLPVGANDTVLVADSAQTAGVKWATSPTAIPGTIVDAKGDLLVGTANDTVARLPVGANDQVLVADSALTAGVKWATSPTAIPSTLVDAKGDLLVGTADNVVTRKAIGAEGTVPVSRAAQATGIAWEVPAAAVDVSRFPTKDAAGGALNGSVRQFSDWSDTVPAITGTVVPVWDPGTNSYVPTNLESLFAAVDTSTGRIDNTQLPLYHPSLVVVDAGAQPPVGAPVDSVLLRRQTAPSLIPALMDDGFTQASGSVVLNSGAGFSVGDDVGLAIAASGEVELPATWNMTYTTGVAPLTLHQASTWTGASQANIYQGRCTTAIPSNTNVTLTSRNTANTANQNRAHQMGALFKMPNLAVGTGPTWSMDKTVAGGAGGSSVLDKSVSIATATVQASELALFVLSYNSGFGTLVRTASPTSGWNQLSIVTSTAAAGGRGMLVAYKVLTTTQIVTANVHIDSTDAASGAWAMSVTTFKAA